MSWRSLGTFALLLPPLLAASGLAYILLNTQGSVWAYAARDAALYCAAIIHIFCYLFLLRKFSLLLFILNALFSVTFFVTTLSGALQCSFGGGAYGNCGIGNLIFFALANIIIVISLQFPPQKMLLNSGIFALALVFGLTGPYLSQPLRIEIEAADLQNSCYLQSPTYAEAAHAKRITSAAQLHHGWLIGEHSPRVFKLVKGQPKVWQYATRSFHKYSHRAEYGKAEQAPDFVKLCAP